MLWVAGDKNRKNTKILLPKALYFKAKMCVLGCNRKMLIGFKQEEEMIRFTF